MIDLPSLPFDPGPVLAGLRPWVECESPTYDAPSVDRMMDLAARDLRAAGATVEQVAGHMGFGGSMRAVLPHPRAGEGGVLVMSHLDTVHPAGTLSALPWRREAGRVYGPGVLDMKGGAFLALHAWRTLAAAGVATALPVTMLLTSDEEVGSPSTRALIEAEARRHRYVLIPEPGRADGTVTTGRYAIARFNLRTTGRPSHAGARLSEGRSAVAAMARHTLAVEAMTTPDCTYSVGVVHGGQWVNCVPTHCDARVLSMAKRQEDLDRGVARLLTLAGTHDGVALAVERDVTRPVWEPDAASLALYEQARAIAARLGQPLPHGSAGGGSDGNFTGALGIPTLDGLGPWGGGVHTPDEHLVEASLAPRGRLLAGLMAELG